MTDPYNTATPLANPYAPPAANVAPRPPVDPISRLHVAESWKEIFRLIEQAGGSSLRKMRALAPSERRRVQFNVLGLLVGPIYYLMKGLWRPALAMFAVAFAVIFLLTMAGVRSANLGVGFGVVCAMRANVLYYKKMVEGDSGWF
jgi:hypothetical protein